MKHLANLWKVLPVEEKNRFEEMSKIDKQRYAVELSAYTGPLQIPRLKKEKSKMVSFILIQVYIQYRELQKKEYLPFFPIVNKCDQILGISIPN